MQLVASLPRLTEFFASGQQPLPELLSALQWKLHWQLLPQLPAPLPYPAGPEPRAGPHRAGLVHSLLHHCLKPAPSLQLLPVKRYSLEVL